MAAIVATVVKTVEAVVVPMVKVVDLHQRRLRRGGGVGQVVATLRELEHQAHMVSECRAEVRGRAFEALIAHHSLIEDVVHHLDRRKEPPAELPGSRSPRK